MGVGYAFYIPALPTEADDFALVQFKDASNNNLSTITVDTAGQIQYRLGAKDGTVLGTSDGQVITTESYQHFEVEMFADQSAGTVEVRIDGVVVLNLAGLDNIPSTYGAPAQVRLGCDGNAKTGAPVYVDIDDLFIRDDTGTANNDFIGDKKAYLGFALQDEAEQDWTPNTGGDAFEMLDQVPPDDDNFFLTAVGGQSENERTTVGVFAFDSAIVEIAAVYSHTRLWKTDAGGASVLVGMISDATEVQGSTHTVATGVQWFNDFWEVDPDTASAWTLAAVNAATVSLERTE